MAFSTLVAQMADRLVVLRRVLMVAQTADRLVVLRRVLMVDHLAEQLADRLVV